MTGAPCKLCGADTVVIGRKNGRLTSSVYDLRHCQACDFYFVPNPCTDYAKLYGPDYYRGQGADRSIDYLFELEHPEESIRAYEYRGIVQLVERLAASDRPLRWLDYGCGLGGLVHHLQAHTRHAAFGFDMGYAAEVARQHGLSLLTAAHLEAARGSFDVVTSIETIEHVEDPKPFVGRIQSLLRPGGSFFLTTGNARPFARHILDWSYFEPEIHISLFTRTALERLFRPYGLTLRPCPAAGLADIYKYKLLKNLGLKRRRALLDLLPWGIIARALDAKYQLSDTIIAGCKPRE
jgi:SAM-dependent methyltransferase